MHGIVPASRQVASMIGSLWGAIAQRFVETCLEGKSREQGSVGSTHVALWLTQHLVPNLTGTQDAE